MLFCYLQSEKVKTYSSFWYEVLSFQRVILNCIYVKRVGIT